MQSNRNDNNQPLKPFFNPEAKEWQEAFEQSQDRYRRAKAIELQAKLYLDTELLDDKTRRGISKFIRNNPFPRNIQPKDTLDRYVTYIKQELDKTTVLINFDRGDVRKIISLMFIYHAAQDYLQASKDLNTHFSASQNYEALQMKIQEACTDVFENPDQYATGLFSSSVSSDYIDCIVALGHLGDQYLYQNERDAAGEKKEEDAVTFADNEAEAQGLEERVRTVVDGHRQRKLETVEDSHALIFTVLTSTYSDVSHVVKGHLMVLMQAHPEYFFDLSEIYENAIPEGKKGFPEFKRETMLPKIEALVNEIKMATLHASLTTLIEDLQSRPSMSGKAHYAQRIEENFRVLAELDAAFKADPAVQGMAQSLEAQIELCLRKIAEWDAKQDNEYKSRIENARQTVHHLVISLAVCGLPLDGVMDKMIQAKPELPVKKALHELYLIAEKLPEGDLLKEKLLAELIRKTAEKIAPVVEDPMQAIQQMKMELEQFQQVAGESKEEFEARQKKFAKQIVTELNNLENPEVQSAANQKKQMYVLVTDFSRLEPNSTRKKAVASVILGMLYVKELPDDTLVELLHCFSPEESQKGLDKLDLTLPPITYLDKEGKQKIKEKITTEQRRAYIKDRLNALRHPVGQRMAASSKNLSTTLEKLNALKREQQAERSFFQNLFYELNQGEVQELLQDLHRDANEMHRVVTEWQKKPAAEQKVVSKEEAAAQLRAALKAILEKKEKDQENRAGPKEEQDEKKDAEVILPERTINMLSRTTQDTMHDVATLLAECHQWNNRFLEQEYEKNPDHRDLSLQEMQEKASNLRGEVRQFGVVADHPKLEEHQRIIQLLSNKTLLTGAILDITGALIKANGAWWEVMDSLIKEQDSLAAEIYGNHPEYQAYYFQRYIFLPGNTQEKINEAAAVLSRQKVLPINIYSNLFIQAKDFYRESKQISYFAIALLKQPEIASWLLGQDNEEQYSAIITAVDTLFKDPNLAGMEEEKKERTILKLENDRNRALTLFDDWTPAHFNAALSKVPTPYWIAWGALTNAAFVASKNPAELSQIVEKTDFTKLTPEQIKKMDKQARMQFLQSNTWSDCKTKLIGNNVNNVLLKQKIEALRHDFTPDNIPHLQTTGAGLVAYCTRDSLGAIVRRIVADRNDQNPQTQRNARQAGWHVLQELSEGGFLSQDAALVDKINRDGAPIHKLMRASVYDHTAQDSYSLEVNNLVVKEIEAHAESFFQEAGSSAIKAILSSPKTVNALHEQDPDWLHRLGAQVIPQAGSALAAIGRGANWLGTAATGVGVLGAIGMGVVGVVGLVTLPVTALVVAGAVVATGVVAAVGGQAIKNAGEAAAEGVWWQTRLGYGLKEAALKDKLSMQDLLDSIKSLENQVDANPNDPDIERAKKELIKAIPLFFTECCLSGVDQEAEVAAAKQLIAYMRQSGGKEVLALAWRALTHNDRLDAINKGVFRASVCFSDPEMLQDQLNAFNQDREIPGILRKTVTDYKFIAFVVIGLVAACVFIPPVLPAVLGTGGAMLNVLAVTWHHHPWLVGIAALVGCGAAKLARDNYKTEKAQVKDQFALLAAGLENQGEIAVLDGLLKQKNDQELTGNLSQSLGKSLAICYEHGHDIAGKNAEGEYYIKDKLVRKKATLLRDKYYYEQHKTWGVIVSLLTFTWHGVHRMQWNLAKLERELSLAQRVEMDAKNVAGQKVHGSDVDVQRVLGGSARQEMQNNDKADYIYGPPYKRGEKQVDPKQQLAPGSNPGIKKYKGN